MLVALVALASSAAYSLQDVVDGHRAGLPEGTLRSMASQVEGASAEQRGCLVLAGLPDAVVAAVEGPSAAEVDAAACEALSLDAAKLDAEASAHAEAAREAFERASEERIIEDPVQCFDYMPRLLDDSSDFAQQLDQWMTRQLAEGRDTFVSASANLSLSGGGADRVAVCAY